MPSKELADYLLDEAGVSCLNGGSFGEYGDGYIRFSYANSLANLMEAVERIKKVSVRWEAAAVAQGLNRFQSCVARDGGEIAVPVPDRNAILNRNCRDEAIHGRPDGQTSSSALAIDIGCRKKQRERDGIAQNRYCQKRLAKGVAFRAGPQALQDLLNHRTARHEDQAGRPLAGKPLACLPGVQSIRKCRPGSFGLPGAEGAAPGTVLAHGRQVTPPNARPEELRDGLDLLQADDFPKSGVDRGGIRFGAQDPRGLFQQLLI